MPRGLLTVANVPQWVRGPARLEDGWIVVDSTRTEPYLPLSVPARTLMFSLANAQTPEQVLRFVAEYGLLKHGPETAELREPLTDFENEATLLRTTLYLANALRGAVKGDERQIELIRSASGVREFFEAPPKDDQELLMQASKWVAWMVSAQLEDTTLRLDSTSEFDLPDASPDNFAFGVNPPTLLAWVYHAVAHTLAQREPLFTCPACGRMFIREDARQTFCTPACANRARFRRFKERQANRQQQRKGQKGHAKKTRTR